MVGTGRGPPRQVGGGGRAQACRFIATVRILYQLATQIAKVEATIVVGLPELLPEQEADSLSFLPIKEQGLVRNLKNLTACLMSLRRGHGKVSTLLF